MSEITPTLRRIQMLDMACEQVLLAFAKGELSNTTEWEDLQIALGYAQSAMPGRYEEIVAELKDDDAPVRLGDEIVEHERSMEAVNDGFESLAKSIESIPTNPSQTAVEEYAAWLARQPKPRTMEEALKLLPPGVTGVMMDPNKSEVVHNAIAEALEDTQGLLAAMLHETRPAEEIEDQMVKNRVALTKIIGG